MNLSLKEIKEETFLKKNYKNILNVIKSDYTTKYVVDDLDRNEILVYTFKDGRIIDLNNSNRNSVELDTLVSRSDFSSINKLSWAFTVITFLVVFCFRRTLLLVNKPQLYILCALVFIVCTAYVWNRVTGLRNDRDMSFQVLLKITLKSLILLVALPVMLNGTLSILKDLGLIILVYLSMANNIIELAKLKGLNY